MLLTGQNNSIEMSESTSTADHRQTRKGKIMHITSSEKGQVIRVTQNRGWGDKKIRIASWWRWGKVVLDSSWVHLESCKGTPVWNLLAFAGGRDIGTTIKKIKLNTTPPTTCKAQMGSSAKQSAPPEKNSDQWKHREMLFLCDQVLKLCNKKMIISYKTHRDEIKM